MVIKSRIGIALVSIFIFITLAVDVYAFTCHRSSCGLIALLPAMPWTQFSLLSPHNIMNPFIFQIFNAVIVYFLGCLISTFLILFRK